MSERCRCGGQLLLCSNSAFFKACSAKDRALPVAFVVEVLSLGGASILRRMPSYLFSDAGTTFESQRMVFRQLNSGRLICPPLPSRLLFAVELFAFIVPPGIDGMSGGLIREFAPYWRVIG